MNSLVLIEPDAVFNARCATRRPLTSAPPISSKPGAAPSFPVRLDPLDKQIEALLGQSGRYGLSVWALLDQVAASQNPSSRSERRRLRLAAWQRLSRLIRKGLVHWLDRKSVSLRKLPRLSVKRRRRSRRGSTLTGSLNDNREMFIKQLKTSLLPADNRELTPGDGRSKTESAKVATVVSTQTPVDLEGPQTDIRSAARALAALRSRPKIEGKLSGFVNGVRIRRDQLVRLPDGSVAYALGARRGRVVYFRDFPHVMEPGRWGVLSASDLTVVKNESAAILGAAKRGRREVRSVLKAESARRNGRRPCQRGRRGRPRRQS